MSFILEFLVFYFYGKIFTSKNLNRVHVLLLIGFLSSSNPLHPSVSSSQKKEHFIVTNITLEK